MAWAEPSLDSTELPLPPVPCRTRRRNGTRADKQTHKQTNDKKKKTANATREREGAGSNYDLTMNVR